MHLNIAHSLYADQQVQKGSADFFGRVMDAVAEMWQQRGQSPLKHEQVSNH